MTEIAERNEAPVACHVMAKPSGSVCNIDCHYCFYLEKEKLYDNAPKLNSDIANIIRQAIK